MTRPVVGIIGNRGLVNDRYPVHEGGQMNSCAVSHVAGCIPLLIPADPDFLSIEELMEVAQIVVSKPGGLTVAEVLATGTPLAIVNPLLGPESQNSDFVLENGAAIRLHSPDTLQR